MLVSELCRLERGDQVRIRGRRTIYKVVERAETFVRSKKTGKKLAMIQITEINRMVPFEASGYDVVPVDLKGKRYVQKWRKAS